MMEWLKSIQTSSNNVNINSPRLMLRPQERFKVHYWEIWGRCLINKIEWYNKLGFRWAIWSTDLVPNTTKNIKSMLVKSHIKYIVLKKTSSFGFVISEFCFLRHNVFMKTLFEKQRIRTSNTSFNFPWLFFIFAAYKGTINQNKR